MKIKTANGRIKQRQSRDAQKSAELLVMHPLKYLVRKVFDLTTKIDGYMN